VLGVIVLVGALAFVGCGRPAPQEVPPAPAPTQTADVLLPEWAPENPSPEFLRAARVLKPFPLEPLPAEAETVPGLTDLHARIHSTWPAAYEFFGALTDDQIEHFLSTNEIRIPVKSLTAEQRAALDNWFGVYREAMEGAATDLPVPRDYLVQLYRHGAAEDLSNVDVGFSTAASEGGHMAHIWFWVRQPGGGVTQFGCQFAQI
jgi:hypothetical protein